MKSAAFEPPPKFAFLSGIHPDLDAALCEAEFTHGLEGHLSHHMPQHHQSHSVTFQGEHPSKRIQYTTSDFNKEKFIRHDDDDDDYCLESGRAIASPLHLNESVESIPFSVDGMEKAKRKIKLQAAKIRELEEQLKRMSSIDKSDIDSEKSATRKNLTNQERLDAHRERKKIENKYKEKCGRWESPPPIKKESLVSKVKRRDDLVDRLVLNPKERRRQELVSRRNSFTSGNVKRNSMQESRNSSPLVRRQSIEEEINSISVKIKNSDNDYADDGKRDRLMARLSMSVEERRDTERNQVLAAVKRVNEKRLKITMEDHNVNDHRSSKYPTKRQKDEDEKFVIRCKTCGSTKGCEEDNDDPGTFYCSPCWEEYESRCGYGDDTGIEIVATDTTKDTRMRSNTESETALWIVHDDPKLRNRLVCSGPNQMWCFVETKDPKSNNCLRILHGTIDYSGPVGHSGDRTQLDVQETSRGTECICIGNIRGYIIHYDMDQIRLDQNQSIYEFRLDERESTPLSGENARMSVKTFFEGCAGAVDVILDPQHSPGGWYPIVEAGSLRKIAPQFRSKGIGYIRLGDDMGKNGQAFMSSDGCHTFLFNESVERKNESAYVVRAAVSNRDSKCSRLEHQRNSGERNLTKCKSGAMSLDQVEDSSLFSEGSSEDSMNAGEVLKELQNMEGSKGVKWSEKADLLIKLGKAVSKPEGRSWSESSLNYMQDVISAKNVNIHVLRSALVVIENIGHVLKTELPNQIAWKTIMIETLNLLKNKQCGGSARDVLHRLHGKCYTIGNSLIAISHVLGMGKHHSTAQRKISSKKGIEPIPQSKANNVEIIEWLAVTTESERLLDEINPAMDQAELELLASFFLRHESHRDARCRQNALDGLLHTMLYGIDILGMRVDDVHLLCGDLKTLRPKSWSRLIKSLHMVLKVQHIG